MPGKSNDIFLLGELHVVYVDRAEGSCSFCECDVNRPGSISFYSPILKPVLDCSFCVAMAGSPSVACGLKPNYKELISTCFQLWMKGNTRCELVIMFWIWKICSGGLWRVHSCGLHRESKRNRQYSV